MDKQTESRSQFEEKLVEWWPEAKGNLGRDGDDYVNHFVSYAWAGWRMSRESLVVELPERQAIYASSYGDGYMVPSPSGEALEYDETIEAIQAIGIRIKGEGV